MTIKRLLVANRGEIARRVFRTCRDLGIQTVAVHSDADAGLPFVVEADSAVRLPGDTPAETYLRGDLVLEAARLAGADAVHPGYGFLSENADFARSVIEAGLTWVGPDPASIDAMGSKVAAKKLMEAAGVPVLSNLDPGIVTDTDLPVLVKASAGGGGRGMRVVRSVDELADAVTRAEAEAASAFGDGTVFVEPFVEHGRHVEVQVFGDGQSVLVLGDRDCSVQRNHQKVVEEAPAPGLSDDVRVALHDAARRAAEAIRYRGAGTVEFLYDASRQRFFFLEMNTRLQVEHPVTECVTGLDLVALQVAVAEGRSLDDALPSVPHEPRGHAIEVRLYAEDPAAGWQPQAGTLTQLQVPDVDAELGGLPAYGVRLDSGFRSGDEVGTHYDAMLAKVVVWGPSREAAARRLSGVLRRTRIHGIRTNRELLVEVLDHPAFLAAQLGTDFLVRHDLAALQGAGGAGHDQAALLAAAVARTEQLALERPVQQGIPAGWRNVVSAPQVTTFAVDGADVEVRWLGGRGGYASADLDGAVVVSAEPAGGRWLVVVEHGGVRRRFEVFLAGHRTDVEWAGGHLALTTVPRFVDPADAVAEGSLLAPMPGSVIALRAAAGDEVVQGQPVLVIEAMKMQHTIAAPYDGVVAELPASVGDQVTAGDVLAVVVATSSGDSGSNDAPRGEIV